VNGERYKFIPFVTVAGIAVAAVTFVVKLLMSRILDGHWLTISLATGPIIDALLSGCLSAVIIWFVARRPHP
jgi:hypothetical protein